jgi:hypothetical protein
MTCVIIIKLQSYENSFIYWTIILGLLHLIYHPHSMHISREGSDQHELAIYLAIHDYLSKGYAVVYSAETVSAMEILNKLKRTKMVNDVEDYIENKVLTIVDGEAVSYQKKNLTGIQLVDNLFSTALDARSKSGRKKVIVISNVGPLLENAQNYVKAVESEKAISAKFDENEKKVKEKIEVICCYNSAIIGKLSLSYLLKIANAHAEKLDKDWRIYSTWYPSAIIDMITSGIEKSLDARTAKLILKTFKLVYRMDEKLIVSNPTAFEETLRKLVGISAAELILESIKEEVKRRMESL